MPRCPRIFFTALALPVLFWSALPAFSQPVGEADSDAPMLRITISEQKFLPPAMYGTWNIHATVLSSTAPMWFHNPSQTELWTLNKESGEVFLKNILTQAEASITVDKVEGDTATFHHIASIPKRRMKIIETPTITVKDDTLSGVNRQEIQVFDKTGKLVNTYRLEIQVEGNRLSGPKVTFRDTDTMPEFEVAPIQFQD